ncbi:MAG TPA: bacterial transcriptional activator domain-containing protein [Ktedonobacteraceae bacterium]|nr:bacterial transcriptional activator domain-containing protein [Ktedonobacteraceae bacterium]
MMTMQRDSQVFERVRPIRFIQVGTRQEIPAPLIRVTTCGLLTIDIIDEVISTDPPLARYTSLTPALLRGRGTVPALTMLKLLLNRHERFAPRDWLREQYCHDREVFSSVRLDNIVWQLRNLLCPPTYAEIRKQVVVHIHSSIGSGNGFQLAAFPLIWVDSEALAWHVEQAARMERFGDNGLPFWECAYALAKRGEYLPDEMYSPWSSFRRGEVAGMLRQSVQALARLYQAHDGAAGEEEALFLLRGYWQEHRRDEDILRPLMELLGRRECFQQALEYYEQCCRLLADDQCQPDPRTQDVAAYLRLKQIQRPPLASCHGKREPYAQVLSEQLYSGARNLVTLPPLSVVSPQDHQVAFGKATDSPPASGTVNHQALPAHARSLLSEEESHQK